ALKFISEKAFAASEGVKAIQTVRSLTHPNLLTVEQVWILPGYLVVNMELAEGSLADLRMVYQSDYGTNLPPDETSRYLSQAADALDFLNTKRHAMGGRLHGIQHCAVKESNLLLCGDLVRVADFERATTSSVPHSLASGRHTINYWAPEIFDGYV